MQIIRLSDELGILYIEVGKPTPDQQDKNLFNTVKSIKLNNSKMVSFSSTAKIKSKTEFDKDFQ